MSSYIHIGLFYHLKHLYALCELLNSEISQLKSRLLPEGIDHHTDTMGGQLSRDPGAEALNAFGIVLREM